MSAPLSPVSVDVCTTYAVMPSCAPAQLAGEVWRHGGGALAKELPLLLLSEY